MKVGELMARDVQTCKPSDTLAVAAERMWKVNCGSLPVLEDSGSVVGMLTDRDVCIALGTRDQRASEVPVKEVCSPDAFSCSEDDSLTSVLEMMGTKNVRRLPVLNGDRLVGIVTLGDISKVVDVQGTKGKSGVSPEEYMKTVRVLRPGRTEPVATRN